MSQILRMANFSRVFTSFVKSEAHNVWKCRSCGRNWNITFIYRGTYFSTSSKTFVHKYDEDSIKRTKLLVENARMEHFKELMKIMHQAKLQQGQEHIFRQQHIPTNEQSPKEISNTSDVQTQILTKSSKIKNSVDKLEKDQSSHCADQPKSKKSKKSWRKKSKVKLDTEKPTLAESLTLENTEILPPVKTIHGNKVKHKKTKKKKLTTKQKEKLLVRLLGSHPLVKQMKKNKTGKINPLVIGELEHILQDQSVSPETTQAIQEYLDKVQPKPTLEENIDDLDKSLDKSANELEPLWEEDDLRDPDRLKEVVSKVIKVFHKDVKQQAREKAIAIDDQRRIDMHNRDVAVYIDVCTYIGKLSRVQHLLLGPKKEGKRKKGRQREHRKVTDVRIFNKIMHAWAKKGAMEPLRQYFEYMEQQNLPVNLQSYAAVLECLGKQKLPQHDIVKKVLEDIDRKGFHLEDICVSCVLQPKEWKYVEKAIHSIRPEFKVKYAVSEDFCYNCDLLNQLNTEEKSMPNPYSGLLSTEELLERAKKQETLELNDNVLVESIQQNLFITSRIKKARKVLNLTKESWRTALRGGFLRGVEQLNNKKQDEYNTFDIYPFMRLFPATVYVDIMMQEITSISQEMEAFSPPMSLLHTKLGHSVYNRMVLVTRQKQKQVEKLSKLYADYLTHYNSDVLDSNLRQIMQRLQDEHADGSSLHSNINPWPAGICKAVGRFLMSVIMDEVKINANLFNYTDEISQIPAFYSVTRSRNNVPQEEIMPHPVLVRLYKRSEIRELQFRISDMPSIAPPMPWTSVHMGGNLLCTTKLVKNAPSHFDVHEKVPNQQLLPVFDALNTVSSVPWKINEPMLDLLIDLFNRGGDASLDIPPPTSTCPPPPPFKSEMNPEERSTVIMKRLMLKKKKKEMFSLWCTELYRLSIANKYRNEIFWFPHNIDFRSRFYAVPPHFNHLGSDVARSLLVFAKGKPLGPDGLDWLMIHLINLTGFKKRSPNRERLQFANSIMDKILDSADRPFDGEKWWQDSDEPWQTLLCCKEIANAIRSPDPAQFISHIPVHQDGSCNGLQHYAALGRDQAGAESVNLFPFDSPSDVYSDVVELVEKERAIDAAMGKQVAQALEGFVKRKVIKQTIMTTVYGVTKYGARQQIRGQLEDISDFPQEHVWAGMAYLADKTFFCLQQMFTSTKQIQEWYVLCAELASRICYQPVHWVTPVGWPVLQPYYKHSFMRRPDKPERKITIEKPNAMKQKNAFPPNFIHSLDSTHMMLTAIHCLRHGVSFVAVHDCFWTHAADIDIMNKDCREQFVALHKEPILENLAASLLAQYGFPEEDFAKDAIQVVEAKKFLNKMLGNMPERGSFQIDKVLESTYFFS